MFPSSFHIRLRRAVPTSPGAGKPAHLSTSGAVLQLRLAGLTLVLLAAVTTGVYAQSTGTMQVKARVLPGRPAWTALAVARAAIEALEPALTGAGSVRGADVVRAEAALLPGGQRRRLVVTIHYPYN